MTIEQRVAVLEEIFSKLQNYYMSDYSGEEIDALLQRVDEGEIIIPSSTAGSTKKFKLTVDDTGAVSATEVTT